MGREGKMKEVEGRQDLVRGKKSKKEADLKREGKRKETEGRQD